MASICDFNSTCPCYDKERCVKVEPDTECVVRLIDIYKNLRDEHLKSLDDHLNLLHQQSSIQTSIDEYFKSLKRPFSVSAMWFPNCSPWG